MTIALTCSNDFSKDYNMKYTKTTLSHGYANEILTINLGSGKIN